VADQKLTQLDADSAPSLDDIVYTVNDPVGVKEHKKVTLGDILGLFQSQYHKAEMTRNSSEAYAASGYRKVNLDTLVYDTSPGQALSDTATGTFTIQVDGRYLVHAYLGFTALETSDYGHAIVYKNAALVRDGHAEFGGSGGTHAHCICILGLVATDTLEMYTWTDETGVSSLTTEDGKPRMTVYRLL